MYSLQVVGKEENEVATHYSVEVQVHVCIVVGGRATDSGLEKRSGSAGRAASSCGHSCRCIRYVFRARKAQWQRSGSAGRGACVHVCIVVVGGLQIVVSRSAVAAQAEVQVHVGQLSMHSLHVVGTRSAVAAQWQHR